MKRLIIISLSLMMTIGAFAQQYLTQAKPYGEKLWGYINQNSETVIEPVTKLAMRFQKTGWLPFMNRNSTHSSTRKVKLLNRKLKRYF